MPKQTIHISLTIVSILAASLANAPTALAAPPSGDQPSSAGDATVPAPSGEPVSTSVPGSPVGVPPPEQPLKTHPTPPGAQEETVESEPQSWFARPPLTVTVGQGANKWRATLFGFVEADVMNDSTRSYSDSIGSSIVARNETYEGQVGRTQFSVRNTRFGFALESPTLGGVKPSAVVEGDFFGNQPGSPPQTSEAAYFNSPTFRLRHAYLKLEDDWVDVWAGQTYYLFGWQSYFFPCSVQYLGLPNEAFGRTTQVRLAHTFRSDAVNVDIAVAALRPVQRDSEIPDGNAGLRLSVNHWEGISTPGSGGTGAFPLSIGVSGAVRQFKVDAFTQPPPQSSNSATGWGVSIDALVPVIPANNGYDRGNKLTLTGSFVVGTGIADLVNAGGGASFPTLPNPAQISPAPVYTADVDNGLVTFDNGGVLHTIDWRTFMAGLQYYLPPSGRIIFAANFTEAYSKNMATLYPRGGAEINLPTRVAQLSRYADANVFFDVTPAVRVGASFQYTSTEYVDGETPRNLRWMGSAFYFF
jgi:hypothetical protein